jgi:predicted RecA/RadA family phage recombinase
MAKNRKFRDANITRDLAVASGTISGDPIVDGQLPGLALIDRQTDGRATCQLDGTFLVPVKGIDGSGNIAVAEGDIIYHTQADTPKLSKKATGVRWGIAEAAVSSGATTTIPVKVGN